jgi:hypothetical protein
MFATSIFPQRSRKNTVLELILYFLCPLCFSWTNELFTCCCKSACILKLFQLIPPLTWNLFPHTRYKFLTTPTVFTVQPRESCILTCTHIILGWGFFSLYNTILLLWCWQTGQCKKRYLSGVHKKEFLPLGLPNSVEFRVQMSVCSELHFQVPSPSPLWRNNEVVHVANTLIERKTEIST